MTRTQVAGLHARTAGHKRRVAQAEGIVRSALAVCASWYVAFSAGKDSTVILHMAREFAPATPAQYSARQWDLPETVALLDQTPNLRRVAYMATNDGADWLPRFESREAGDAIHRDLTWLDGPAAITAQSEGGTFLGLRADEGQRRTAHLRSFGQLYRAECDGRWRCNPIAWWSDLDVWAYIASRELPYSAAYDVMERIGVPLRDQRTGPFGRALHAGSLAILKRGWPEFWNRLAAAHPEARAYA